MVRLLPRHAIQNWLRLAPGLHTLVMHRVSHAAWRNVILANSPLRNTSMDHPMDMRSAWGIWTSKGLLDCNCR